jgi:hypothetical protein
MQVNTNMGFRRREQAAPDRLDTPPVLPIMTAILDGWMIGDLEGDNLAVGTDYHPRQRRPY